MDIYYIDNWSLSLDLKILLRTPAAVLTMRGAY
jgi:lipopolysaccharide/colanic/teichoic acid biosynthesis glycosyltransferase